MTCGTCVRKHGGPSDSPSSVHKLLAFQHCGLDSCVMTACPSLLLQQLAVSSACGAVCCEHSSMPVSCRLSNTVSAAAVSSPKAELAQSSHNSPLPVKDASGDPAPRPTKTQPHPASQADESDDLPGEPAVDPPAANSRESSTEEAKETSLSSGTECTSVELIACLWLCCFMAPLWGCLQQQHVCA